MTDTSTIDARMTKVESAVTKHEILIHALNEDMAEIKGTLKSMPTRSDIDGIKAHIDRRLAENLSKAINALPAWAMVLCTPVLIGGTVATPIIVEVLAKK